MDERDRHSRGHVLQRQLTVWPRHFDQDASDRVGIHQSDEAAHRGNGRLVPGEEPGVGSSGHDRGAARSAHARRRAEGSVGRPGRADALVAVDGELQVEPSLVGVPCEGGVLPARRGTELFHRRGLAVGEEDADVVVGAQRGEPDQVVAGQSHAHVIGSEPLPGGQRRPPEPELEWPAFDAESGCLSRGSHRDLG